MNAPTAHSMRHEVKVCAWKGWFGSTREGSLPPERRARRGRRLSASEGCTLIDLFFLVFLHMLVLF